MKRNLKPETVAAGNGIATDETYGAVTPPIYLSSTFAFEGFERSGPYDYSRTANPSRALLADTIARLEGGSGAIITCSGMSAVDLLLSRLSADELVVAPHDCYGGTYRLLANRSERGHFSVSFVNQADETALAAAMEQYPALVLIETPSNPLMRVVDIERISKRAKDVGAKVAVDNTFLTPALQRPLSLGADYVIHSTTKYLNGHSDVVGGALVCAEASEVEEFASWANITGVTGAPFDSYLTLRGVRTLFPRMGRQQSNAKHIASYLNKHPQVSVVHYPGLPDHPGHRIAGRQQSGFGAMLSFELKGGVAAVRPFVEALSVFTLAESLGGVESLAAHPASMTHLGMGASAREAAGIGDGLLRLSIGVEAVNDLITDLEEGFGAIQDRTAA
ncbi:Cystathionine gamma-synthase [Methyloligella halotolerans]|uniref:L-methionine gamma-lyase n=1 Tax=Methyloligella halotolerans TaxID=1177755 RepID=A0A1E2RUY6_9HYPH|nr:cystathionine gamma-synthase [Methyloligella halotolerans]ODA66023.1 Cystathionine gamma-synthase [Methyloligella halotolerans]